MILCENLEAVTFYIGLLIALFIGIKYLIKYLKSRGENEPEAINDNLDEISEVSD